jgi:hypothetical protein
MAAWVPFVGLLSIPVAAVGALIGFIGILVSLIGRRSGVGMPVAGLFVSLLAVGLAVLATGITSAGIAHSVAAANMTNQTVPGAPMGTTEPPTSWAPAGSPVVQGDCQISIKTVRVGKVPLKGLGGETSTSTDDLLMIDVEIANQNATRKLDYKSWAGADFNFGRDFATLTDNFGNVYKRTTFGMDKPVGRVESQSIYPGSPITDQLAFEVPLTNIQFLHLEMPASNIGGDGMLRVEIPASMVQR